MATTIGAGFNVRSGEPIDSRMVHNGRPWTNPNLGGGFSVYEGLVSVDTTGDGTVWYLTNASMATVEAGWTQIGPVTEDYIMTTNTGTDNQVLSLQVDGNNRTLEWITPTTGTGGLTSVATSAPISGDGTSGSPVTIGNGAINESQLNTNSVTESKLNATNSPTNGQILSASGNNGFTWIDAASTTVVRDGAERQFSVTDGEAIQFINSRIRTAQGPDINRAEDLGAAERTIGGGRYKAYSVAGTTNEFSFASPSGFIAGTIVSLRIISLTTGESVSLENLRVARVEPNGVTGVLDGGPVAVVSLTGPQIASIASFGFTANPGEFFEGEQVEVYRAATVLTTEELEITIQPEPVDIVLRDGAGGQVRAGESPISFVGSNIATTTGPDVTMAQTLGDASRAFGGNTYKAFALDQSTSTDEIAFAAPMGYAANTTFSMRVLSAGGLSSVTILNLTVARIEANGVPGVLDGGPVAVATLTEEQVDSITPFGVLNDVQHFFTADQIEIYDGATIPVGPQVNVDTTPDLTVIRSTGSTRHGEFVTLNADGTFTTAPVGTGPGGGVTEDEVQRDIREYTDPRFITSRLTPTFEPESQAFLNANREPNRFSPFSIHRLVNLGAGTAVMSFETSEDALAFAADIQGYDSIGDLLGTIPNIPAGATTAQQWGALSAHNNELVATRRPVTVVPAFTAGGDQVTVLTGVQNTLQNDRGRFFRDQSTNYNDGNGAPTGANVDWIDVRQFRERFTGPSGINVRNGLGTSTGTIRYVTFAYDNNNYGVFRSERVGSGTNVNNAYNLTLVASRGRVMVSGILRVYTSETLSGLPGVTGEFSRDTDSLEIRYLPPDTTPVTWTIPIGHQFIIGNAGTASAARTAANSSFFVSFFVPAEDARGDFPDTSSTGLFFTFRDNNMWTGDGYPRITYERNGGFISTNAFQGNRRVVRLSSQLGELNRFGINIGTVVQFRTDQANQTFHDFPFAPQFRVEGIFTPTQDEIDNQGPGAILNSPGARIVALQPINNGSGSTNLIADFSNLNASSFNVIRHSDDFPSHVLVGPAQSPQVATVSQPELPAQQHVDEDNIPYDGELFISGPNADEIHWVSASSARIINGETLYGFQFEDPAPQEFTPTMERGGVTYNTHDISVEVQPVPNNGIGRDANGRPLARYHGRTTPQFRNFLFGQEVNRPGVSLLNVGNLDGTDSNRRDGQIQAFFSRDAWQSNEVDSNVFDANNLRSQTERTQFLLRPQETINGVQGIALSITDHGDTTDASSQYGLLRSRLDTIRAGTNEQSQNSRRSLFFGAERGVSAGEGMAGVQLTGIIITDENGVNIQNAGATAPLFDVVNNWSIQRLRGNWVWFYTGSAPLMENYRYEHAYIFRRPRSIYFNSNDGPNVVNVTDTDEQAAQRLYPALVQNKSYFRRFVRLNVDETREYFQGDLDLGNLGGVIEDELSGNIPFEAALNPLLPAGSGSVALRSGLYLKTTNDDIEFVQRRAAETTEWAMDGGNPDYLRGEDAGILPSAVPAGNGGRIAVTHVNGGLYATGPGTIGIIALNDPNEASQTGTAPVRKPGGIADFTSTEQSAGIIFGLASDYTGGPLGTNRLVVPQTARMLGISDTRIFNGEYDPNGIRNDQGHEIVIRFQSGAGTGHGIDPVGWVVVGIGTRIPLQSGFGQNQCIVEIVRRDGGLNPVPFGGIPGTTALATPVQLATNDPVGFGQTLSSNGWALYRFDDERTVENNQRGSFTEVLLPATMATITQEEHIN